MQAAIALISTFSRQKQIERLMKLFARQLSTFRKKRDTTRASMNFRLFELPVNTQILQITGPFSQDFPEKNVAKFKTLNPSCTVALLSRILQFY